MANISEEILIDALEIRDTHEHLSREIPVGNAGYGDFTMFLESTLKAAGVTVIADVEVYVRRTDGKWCVICFGFQPVGSVSVVESYSGPYPWVRVGVTAQTAPDAGGISVAVALKPA